MKRINFFTFSSMVVLVVAVLFACKKDADVTVPPVQAHFANRSTGNFIMTSAANNVYKIPIGLTAPSSEARTVKISVTSPTGAVAGTHYTVNSTTFTIPAGKVTDTLVLTGTFAQYTSGRKDTLVFTIEGLDKGSTVMPSDYNNTLKLFMRGPCSEAELNDVDSEKSFLGDYNNTNEDFGGAYGPYKTTITSAVRTGPTTANVTIANVFDAGWNPMTVTLDWTDLANKKVTFVAQNVGGNAGAVFGATYNGFPYAIRPASSGQIGTFSYCNQTISFYGNVGVWGVGYSGTLYTVNMAR